VSKSYLLLVIINTLLLVSIQVNAYQARINPRPLLIVGGGYLDTRKWPGGEFQIEYKFGKCICYHLRPQVTFLWTQFASGFIGYGIGWELYMGSRVLIIPSFSPGIYWRGHGRDLGCPIEFQSGLEIAYEIQNKGRIGLQISHVSNAHLSHTNPGFNSLTLRVAIPLMDK
jgi:hypothetical protein